MNDEDVLLSNRLRLRAFTGLNLEVDSSYLDRDIIRGISSPATVTTYLRVSDYAMGLGIKSVILPVGSKIIFVLDDSTTGKSNFTDMPYTIGYDLTNLTDKYYNNRIIRFGVDRFAKGLVVDNNFERLAKAMIDDIFNGYEGYDNASTLRSLLSNYTYLAEAYLTGYDEAWLRRLVTVLDYNQRLRSALKGVLRYSGIDFEFLKWLHKVLIASGQYKFINNLVTYSLFISDSRLFMVEQLRQFLVNYYWR